LRVGSTVAVAAIVADDFELSRFQREEVSSRARRHNREKRIVPQPPSVRLGAAWGIQRRTGRREANVSKRVLGICKATRLASRQRLDRETVVMGPALDSRRTGLLGVPPDHSLLQTSLDGNEPDRDTLRHWKVLGGRCARPYPWGGSLYTSSGHSSSTTLRRSLEISGRLSVSSKNSCRRSKSSCIMM
jgi:hypothetical protein